MDDIIKDAISEADQDKDAEHIMLNLGDEHIMVNLGDKNKEDC